DWAKAIDEREGVKRGRIVNRSWGEEWEQLAERHSAADVDNVLKLKP
ncbi:glutathione-dependent disulfide-bond oxidoreductase, partial [Vibrio parahaemolyticus]|nr:glutathione-dependent disulfide-bond oxidoreductase [Vibrio parahaemolyticus]